MKHKSTRLSHLGRGTAMPNLGSATVSPAIYRGSTLLSPTIDAHEAAAKPETVRQRHHNGYGTGGTDTHKALESMLSDLEEAEETVLFPSGLAAITTVLLAFCRAGNRLLITDNAYSPARRFAEQVLAKLGVQVDFFDPQAPLEETEARITPETRLMLLEAPGSLTFEMSDLRGLAALARQKGVTTVMDNTWASPLYCQPLTLGIDLSLHAATKYISGHSDLLMGSVSGNGETIWRVREMHFLLGQSTSADDVGLALRGMRTLAVRMPRHQQSALALAHWLEGRAEVASVLHPALPSHPGHAFWQRDFSGASGLFGLLLTPEFSDAQARAFCDALQLFGHGDSWGGYESLAMPRYHFTRSAKPWPFSEGLSGPLLRLNIGLEEIDDLRTDLEQGFAAMQQVEA